MLAWSVFRDVCRFWKVHNKCPKLRRSSSDLRNEQVISPDSNRVLCSSGSSATTPNGTASYFPNGSLPTISPIMMIGRRWTEVGLNEEGEAEGAEHQREVYQQGGGDVLPPFRGRASTDGNLLSRPRKWRYPPPAPSSQLQYQQGGRPERRMSISMRGNNASY
uniref:Uncharacterized protein n=1 Tax=Timema monikensis TaxID=170555 RepID=A0A7R9HM72_9NEOP|nr:unnamed protein product [Timema monikensis]